jgi:hypothetical protein
MAAQAASTPAGRVTEVFKSSAEREGAFRLLESAAVSADRVAAAAFEATAQRCNGEKLVYVALDGSTLTLTDRKKHRELGRVGAYAGRGLHVMTALGIDERGTTCGLLAQHWWARTEKRTKRAKCYGKRYLERETRYWLDAINSVQARLTEHAPQTRAWYQLDRGADGWPIFALAVEQQLLLTVRSCHDRRLIDEQGRRVYLRETLRKAPILGYYNLQLPERPGRPARKVQMAVFACTVTLNAQVGHQKWRNITLNAVLAQEVGGKLSWSLLTTAPVATLGQAMAVVEGYTLRWRVEEFHRAWKRGCCRVEESQLQRRGTLIKWATILAAVAARALRIAQLLRSSPDIPASDEFTDYEIAATFALARKKLDRRRSFSFKEIVDMIADLGGFANKYSGGKPGPTVIGRGLERVVLIAKALKNIDELR